MIDTDSLRSRPDLADSVRDVLLLVVSWDDKRDVHAWSLPGRPCLRVYCVSCGVVSRSHFKAEAYDATL